MSLLSPVRLAVAVCALAPFVHAERWDVQYFYDEAKSDLTINDLAFPTARRGVAVGYITRGEDTKGTAAVTSDGGANWSLVPLPDAGLSVFFLNDSLGWVVTPKGIYRTNEGGRTWRKLPKSPKGAARVWFLDEERGYAAGIRKSIWQTADAGKSWQRLPVAAAVKTSPDYTVFSSISFVGPVGYITGWSRPPRPGDERLPDWMEPEKAARRKELPNVSILVATRDGGKTWESSTVSIFGHIGRVRLSPDGRALGLIEFDNIAPHPSEVLHIDLRTGKSQSVYADKLRAVTDFAIARSGPVFLAATEVAGRLRAPIPGRLHILISEDMKLWREMEVDYRADARRAVLAAVDSQNVWVATDTGMILRLVP